MKYKYTIRQNLNHWQLWIRINNQYSQVFKFDTKKDAEIAMQQAIAADQERLAEIPTISEYFKVEAK